MTTQTAPTKSFFALPRLAFTQTLCYYIVFIALGLSYAIIGPSLDALAVHTGSTLSALSAIFITGALGRTVGSLVAGRIYDRLRGNPIIATALITIALMHFLIPLMNILWLLLAVAFLLGLAEGTLDVGCNTQIILVHGKNVGPYMSGLHFTFGIGNLIVPLLVAASLKLTGDVRGAFWLIALIFAPLALLLLRLRSPAAQHEDHTARAAQSIPAGLVMLFALFFFLFVGVESVLGSWAFNYGKRFGLDEIGAGGLASTYFGGFTLGRLLSIPIATRMKPKHILLMDIVVLFVGMALLLMANEPGPLLWVGIFVVGLGVASCFPAALSYAEESFPVTGTMTGIFLATSNMGAMFFPWLIGQFFEVRGPIAVTLVLAVTIVGTGIMFVVLNNILRKPALAN